MTKSDCPACAGANKQCSMNCGPAAGDKRTRAQQLSDCDECYTGCSRCEATARQEAYQLLQRHAAAFRILARHTWDAKQDRTKNKHRRLMKLTIAARSTTLACDGGVDELLALVEELGAEGEKFWPLDPKEEASK